MFTKHNISREELLWDGAVRCLKDIEGGDGAENFRKAENKMVLERRDRKSGRRLLLAAKNIDKQERLQLRAG